MMAHRTPTPISGLLLSYAAPANLAFNLDTLRPCADSVHDNRCPDAGHGTEEEAARLALIGKPRDGQCVCHKEDLVHRGVHRRVYASVRDVARPLGISRLQSFMCFCTSALASSKAHYRAAAQKHAECYLKDVSQNRIVFLMDVS
jgi:hypothetical protein